MRIEGFCGLSRLVWVILVGVVNCVLLWRGCCGCVVVVRFNGSIISRVFVGMVVVICSLWCSCGLFVYSS